VENPIAILCASLALVVVIQNALKIIVATSRPGNVKNVNHQIIVVP
tara:strand:+ start:419 stop:556 length:138 start_codon:yes stop_codon:yes gene_type:complete